ncbi:SWT1-like protein [Mya arenaria]|uniref:SWT1-like protein n=1 Tax=Mya arenaria TaxID=6604 RepID=A0ABY7GDB2_MYAAR|nr:SWT1-like protein [Mya arenaria]
MAEEKVQLPFGWIVKQSKSYPDRIYYFNINTGASTWQFPDLLQSYMTNQEKSLSGLPVLSATSLQSPDCDPPCLGFPDKPENQSGNVENQSGKHENQSREVENQSGVHKNKNASSSKPCFPLNEGRMGVKDVSKKVRSNSLPRYLSQDKSRDVSPAQIPRDKTVNSTKQTQFAGASSRKMDTERRHSINSVGSVNSESKRLSSQDKSHSTMVTSVQSKEAVINQDCGTLKHSNNSMSGRIGESPKLSQVKSPKERILNVSKENIVEAIKELQQVSDILRADLSKTKDFVGLSTPIGRRVPASSTGKDVASVTSRKENEKTKPRVDETCERQYKSKCKISPVKAPKQSVNLDKKLGQSVSKVASTSHIEKNEAPGMKRKIVIQNEDVDKKSNCEVVLPLSKRFKSCTDKSVMKVTANDKAKDKCVKNTDLEKRQIKGSDDGSDKRKVVKQRQSKQNESRKISLKDTKLTNLKPETINNSLQSQTDYDLRVNTSAKSESFNSDDKVRKLKGGFRFDGETNDDDDDDVGDSNNNTELRLFIGEKEKLVSIQSWINNLEDGGFSSDSSSQDCFKQLTTGLFNQSQDSGFHSTLVSPQQKERVSMEIEECLVPKQPLETETQVETFRYEEEDMEIDNVLTEVRSQLKCEPGTGVGCIDIPVESCTTRGDKSSLTELELLVVLDTNVLISNLDMVDDLKDWSIQGLGWVCLYVPWIVLMELDRLKSTVSHGKPCLSSRTQHQARKAISFLKLLFTSKHPRIIGQTAKQMETAKEEFEAEYGNAILFSNDHNLCIKSLVTDIPAFNSKDILSGIENVAAEMKQSKTTVDQISVQLQSPFQQQQKKLQPQQQQQQQQQRTISPVNTVAMETGKFPPEVQNREVQSNTKVVKSGDNSMANGQCMKNLAFHSTQKAPMVAERYTGVLEKLGTLPVISVHKTSSILPSTATSASLSRNANISSTDHSASSQTCVQNVAQPFQKNNGSNQFIPETVTPNSSVKSVPFKSVITTSTCKISKHDACKRNNDKVGDVKCSSQIKASSNVMDKSEKDVANTAKTTVMRGSNINQSEGVSVVIKTGTNNMQTENDVIMKEKDTLKEETTIKSGSDLPTVGSDVRAAAMTAGQKLERIWNEEIHFGFDVVSVPETMVTKLQLLETAVTELNTRESDFVSLCNMCNSFFSRFDIPVSTFDIPEPEPAITVTPVQMLTLYSLTEFRDY